MFDFDEDLTREFCERAAVRFDPSKEDKATALCELAYYAHHDMTKHLIEATEGWADEGYLTQSEADRIIEAHADED